MSGEWEWIQHDLDFQMFLWINWVVVLSYFTIYANGIDTLCCISGYLKLLIAGKILFIENKQYLDDFIFIFLDFI